MTFRDHCEVDGRTARKSVRCRVWGKLVKADAQALVVRGWEAMFRSKADRAANATDWVILRSTIEGVDRLTAEAV